MILAIDPSSSATGYALSEKVPFNNHIIFKDYGTVSFTKPKEKGYGHLFHEFNIWLSDLVDDHRNNLEMIVCENQCGNRGIAAYILQNLQGIVQKVAEVNEIPYYQHSPGTIKKHITGKGNAPKSKVVEAVKALGYDVEDDNQADAIALLLLSESIKQQGDL